MFIIVTSWDLLIFYLSERWNQRNEKLNLFTQISFWPYWNLFLTLFYLYPPLKQVLSLCLTTFLVAFQAPSRHLTVYRTSLIKNYLELEQNLWKSFLLLYERAHLHILPFVIDVFRLAPLLNQNARKNVFLGDWQSHWNVFYVCLFLFL